MHKRFFAGLACLALFLFQPLCAQKEGAVWYFGRNAGLDFNQYYPKPLTDGKITTREGVATICDKDGNLLFYTDGQTVYNRNHDIMQDGEGLFGDVSSTQSSIIVPRPGSATEFYIFTVDQAVGTYTPSYKGLNYSIVDMEQGASLGRVTKKNTPLPDAANILFTEKITVVKNSEGNYWIIAHEFGSAKFFEFFLTNSDITLKYTPARGTSHVNPPDDRDNRGATGYLKSSPKGDYLATAIEGMKFFELFSFDKKTGDIKVIARLPAGDTLDPYSLKAAAYGVEFSPTSNFLYGSTRKGGILYQWDISDPNENSIKSSVQILRQQTSVLCGALQLGLNGKIYVSLSGQPFLGVINSPIQKKCNYVEHGASLMNNATGDGGNAYFGLPTFLSDFFQAAQFYYENTCQNDLTRFYLSANKGTIEGFPSWTIFNADTIQIGQADVNPETMEGTFRFAQPGSYLVKFQVTQFGGLIKQDQVITIHPLPELSFPDTTSMCKGSPARLDAGDGAFYSWRDNQNLSVERYRSINNPGKYVVTVTHYNGCSNTDSTLVAEKPLPVINDTIITLATCGVANGSITLKMEEGDQYDFSWDHDPDNRSNQALNLAFGVYLVKITSLQTGCQLTSKHSVSEENAPKVLVRSSVSGAVCPGTKVTLTAEGAPNYQWENPYGIQAEAIEVTPSETTTYRVKGYSYDQVTQDTCSAFGEMTVEVFPVNPPQLGKDRIGCLGDTLTLDGGSEYLAWTWSHNESTQKTQISQSIDNLSIMVMDKNKCILADTINVLFNPLPEINLGKDILQCQGKPVELFGGTGDSLVWSTGETSDRIFTDASATYRLSVWKNGCMNIDSVRVTIKPLPEVNLNMPRDTTVCLSGSLELNGGNGGNEATYLWSTGETSPGLYVSQSGEYWITISIDGCLNSDTVSLTINPFPKVELGKDTVYCKSNPIQLYGGEGDSYDWSTGETTHTISVSETGTYRLTINKTGCFGTDSVMIRINDPGLLVIESVTPSPITCPGNRDGSLMILAHGSGTSYEYSINNGLNFSTSPWFQGLDGNTPFQVVVREDKGCTVKWPDEIIFEEPDSILINYHLVSPSCETCPDGEINLSIKGGIPPYSVKWSTDDTLTNLSNMVLGKYLVWVTDAAKCRENALIDLTLDYPPFRIPNAFTPNGDGINEKWEIAALRDFKDCELKIFDRSGKLIWWSETGYPEPWGGTDKSGTTLPVGSYYYLVWLARDLKPLKGSVSILR